jgi:outer membrane protein OmpA-like peptidoglycan-associated protein
MYYTSGMHDYIGVKTRGTRFLKLLDLDGARRGRQVLTTVEDYQSRVCISLHRFRGSERRLIADIPIGSIPQELAGRPELTVSGDFDGSKTLSIKISVNGVSRHSARFTVRGRLSLPFKPLHAAYAGAFVLAIVLVLVLVKSGTLSPTGIRGSNAASAGTVQSRSALSLGTGFNRLTLRRPRRAEPARGAASEITREDREQGDGKNLRKGMGENAAEPPASERPDVERPPAEGTVTEKPPAERPPDAPKRETLESAPTASGDGDDRSTPAAVMILASLRESAAGAGTDGAPSPAEPALLVETIYFNPSSARLTQGAKSKLTRMLELVEDTSIQRITIDGHCAIAGTERGRKKLSTLRARVVGNYLTKNGWSPDIDTELAMNGWGSRKVHTTDPDQQHLNRRVVVQVEYIGHTSP